MKTLFITGIDTGIGKTYVGRILVKALNKSGYSCVPRKPVESGCETSNDELIPEDALKYFHAANEKIPLEEICPYRYEPPISPERAIRLANEVVTVKDLVNRCTPVNNPDYLFIEGAGGFYSPLCSDGLNADLAQKLKANMILVVKDRLGCINQALLNIEAIKNRKLKLLAVVLNQTREHEESSMDNLDDLRMRLSIPVIPIPNMVDADQTMLDMQYNAIDELLRIIQA
ncbi:MAG: dethiobiotin synthase [Gammaproteobacteria bacterium]